MKKRILSCFLALAMALSLLPMSVLAAGEDPLTGTQENPITATSDGITVNKYVSGNAEDGYQLTMEAYASDKVTSSTTTKPLDIVLVLDVSGSMDYNFNGKHTNKESEKRITALKTAVTSFIDSVTENAKETGANHQIGIVTFASQAKIINNLTPVSSDAGTLKNSVNRLTANGATRADFGMEDAKDVLETAQGNSEKIVIMFTDGEPTSGSSYEGSVAHGAVNTAKELKDSGVTVYTIGIFSGADPDSTRGNANKYMNAVSSNYPDAYSEGNWLFGYEIELGNRAEGKYYFASDNAEGLEDVFKTIADTVTSSTLKANPDSTAVLSDTLSQYFNFPEGLTDDSNDITVKQVPVTGKNGNSYSWGNATDVSNVKVSVDKETGKIEITGFDYKANAVTETTEDGLTTYTGSKLVVSFPIVVDMNACLEAPTESNYYPTNNITDSPAGLFYKSEHASTNDTYTNLSASPAVLLTDLDANGTDVTVQVYVDGILAEKPLDYITLEISTKDTSFDYLKTTVSENGTITCDFNYNPTSGGHDCIDFKVTLKDSYTYLLQGVHSYQSYGMNGTNNVTTEGNSYIIDNVTASTDSDVDCTIYLSTKYSVEYYQGSNKLTEAPYNDTNVYIAEESVDASTEEDAYPAKDNSTWMDWKNETGLASISLPALPNADTGYTNDGWFLGSVDGNKQTSPVAVSAVKDSAAERVIQFYATSSVNQYTITINYVDGEGSDLKTAYSNTQNYGYEYSFDVSSDASGDIPFIITKDDTQYVFNRFTAGGEALSGALTENLVITAEYLPDTNGNEIPDLYEATVTYKVVNGTWSDDTSTDKTATFALKAFDHASNTWVVKDPAPTLGDSIPTGMKPVTGYADNGAWNTVISSETEVTGNATYTYTFSLKQHTITINYVDGEGSDLKTAYSNTQNYGYEYSFDVSSDASGDIPFIITKDDTQYVFNRFTAGGEALSGALTENLVITAQYLPDANGNEIPDAYEATVTYKVVNGTWSDDTAADKTADFILRMFNDETNSWDEQHPKLGNTIPTGMKADPGYASEGSWSDTIDADTLAVNGAIYTYTFADRVYTLTYDANGGKTDSVPTDDTPYKSGNTATLDTETVPTHDKDGDTSVIFIGWSETKSDTIFSAGQDYGDTVETVSFTDKNITVYAVWGYDTNGDNIPDATQVLIEPAAMTIYTGGNGYTGVVTDENGNIVDATTEGNGLPEPGFYFTLPYEMDQAIKNAADGEGNAADLSQYLTITAKANSETGTSEDRSWTIQLYNPDGTSDVNGRYVYSFDPGEGQAPVRMQFTDAEGKIIISDAFDIKTALYEEYIMSLYHGSVDANTVQAEATVGQEKLTAAVGLVDSTLTIRGVTDSSETTQIKGSIDQEDKLENITATTNGETLTYYINGSQIPVGDQNAVQLLVDEIAGDENTKNALLNMAEDKLPENAAYEFKYLDLVDTSNGNVWVTMGKDDSLTVYWPYPEGTDKDDTFTIVHYKGLDREFDLSDLNEQNVTLEVYSTENGKLEATDQGLKFTVNSFSPFVLAYDNAEEYTVTYDANGGRGTMTDENSPYQDGSTVTVLDNEFYWTRHTFTGWNTEADGSGTAYQPGDTFEISSDTTLYAQWRYTGGGGTVDPPELDTENHYGYIVGYDDGTVRPNGKITRAEVATIFFRLLTDESRDAYWCQTNDFSDVSASDWYNNAISTLTNAGILDGYEDGTFRPNGNITRAEFATIAVRFFDLTYEGEDLFPDISDHWARDYINQAAAAGFVNGYEDGTFRPNNAITRAEAVTLVNRTLERKPHKAHLLDDMIQWPDNMDQTTWYYADIQEATNSHEYYMTTSEQGEEYEIWTKILPVRDWPALEKEWSDANSSTGTDVTN